MLVNDANGPFGRLPIILGTFLVYPLWILLAVRTVSFLRFMTRHSIPFSKRAIWLIKILALVVGGGGVSVIPDELGLPWYLGVLPAGICIFFAVREKVQDIVPLKPPQNTAAYHSSWEEYRHLRTNVKRAWVGLGIVIVFAVNVSLASVVSQKMFGAVLVVDAILMVAVMVALQYSQWKLLRWPCPRCGSSFRGMWALPFLPKRCRYCGLARWEGNPTHSS